MVGKVVVKTEAGLHCDVRLRVCDSTTEVRTLLQSLKTLKCSEYFYHFMTKVSYLNALLQTFDSSLLGSVENLRAESNKTARCFRNV